MQNFVAHFKQITIRRKQVPIGAAAVALYYTLCEYDNDLGWMDNFTAPNGVLSSYAGLSLDTLKRARAELVEKGYIKYQHGAGNQAGKYLIVDFAPQTAPQATPQSNLIVDFAPQTARQTAHSLHPLTKLNEDQYIPPNPPEGEPPAAGGGGGRKRFTPPTVEEVAAYCRERNNGIDPHAFIDHYTANGWKRGNTPVKDWRACVRTWESRRKEQSAPPPGEPQQKERALPKWD